jgi:hypothetical protein
VAGGHVAGGVKVAVELGVKVGVKVLVGGLVGVLGGLVDVLVGLVSDVLAGAALTDTRVGKRMPPKNPAKRRRTKSVRNRILERYIFVIPAICKKRITFSISSRAFRLRCTRIIRLA